MLYKDDDDFMIDYFCVLFVRDGVKLRPRRTIQSDLGFEKNPEESKGS
jgi:hypothetical protein